MKKICIKTMLALMMITIFSYVGICYASLDKKIEVLGATYEVTENVMSQDVGYGIKHTKDISESSKKNNELFPQSVNVLEIPSREDVKIINWTMSNPTGWSKSTVRKMAQDFESKNPGWVVVAAINGDFFDINGNDKALPYQTGGVTVSNGEVYRPFTNGQTIGFKNDASTDPLVAEAKFEVSNHILSIYDDNDNVIFEKEINKINEVPGDGEISIWYSYRNKEGLDERITLPSENSYLIKTATRLLPMSTSNVYAKGMITAINTETLMFYGQFGLQVNDEEVRAMLDKGVYVRVQQHVIGDYKDCTDITGGGVCLVRDSAAVDNTSNMDTHPRTCVGVKEDGTVVFMTVDGRQDNRNMHGMAYNELSATMLYYGCKEAYNLDGGGSTTMIIRNAYGDFDVMNSPSDGTERNDSNSLLVVVPELSLNIEKVTDTEAVISAVMPKKDVSITDIKVTIDGVTKQIDSFPYTWTNLTANSSYKIEASYTLKYKSSVETKNIIPIDIKTGSIKPFVEYAYYYEFNNGSQVSLNYKLSNQGNVTCINNLVSGYYFNALQTLEARIILNKNQIDVNDINIVLGYNLKSSVSDYTEEEIKVTKIVFNTYPTDVLDFGNQVNSYTYTDELPKLSLDNYVFLGWSKEENSTLIVYTKASELDLTEEVINLYPCFSPIGGNEDDPIIIPTPEKKGCSKSATSIIVSTLTAISLAVIVLRKSK